MPVAVRAEVRLRVVHVQAPQSLEADGGDALVEHRLDSLRRADLEASREEVTRGQANANPVVPAAALNEGRELGERTAERALRTRRVLEQQRAALGLGECDTECLAGQCQALLERLALKRAGVDDDAVRVDRVAQAQRVRQRGDRLRAN